MLPGTMPPTSEEWMKSQEKQIRLTIVEVGLEQVEVG